VSDGDYKIFKITSVESLKIITEGTPWCTRGSYKGCLADQYLDQYKAIFIVLKNGIKFAQYTDNLDEIKDVNNNDFVPDDQLFKLMS